MLRGYQLSHTRCKAPITVVRLKALNAYLSRFLETLSEDFLVVQTSVNLVVHIFCSCTVNQWLHVAQHFTCVHCQRLRNNSHRDTKCQ